MHVTGLQVLSLVLGIIVAATMLLTFIAKQLLGAHRALTRIEDAIGLDADGKTLRQNVGELTTELSRVKDDVGEMHATLNNGMRSEVVEARQQAAAAATLAGRAATAAATAEQHSNDAMRGVHAMRAGQDIVLRAVMRDIAGIWTALASMGVDRRQLAIEDVGDPSEH